MQGTEITRELKIALTAAALGSGIGLAGAHAAARLMSTDPPGACRQNDTTFATAGGGCQDLQTGRIWSRGSYDTAGHLSYRYFKNWCADKTEDGFSDWRMPTKDELNTLASHDTIVYSPTDLVGTTAHLQTGGSNELKWSGTSVKGTKYVYQVSLRDGSAVAADTGPGGPLAEGLCVR